MFIQKEKEREDVMVQPRGRAHTYDCQQVESGQNKSLNRQIEDVITGLEEEILKKQLQAAKIGNTVKSYYNYQSTCQKLSSEQARLESEIEDLELFREQVKKDLRLLHQEEQVKKGKTIVLCNKITDLQLYQKTQGQRKEVLEKHLEELNKSTSQLQKKVGNLKDGLLKKGAQQGEMKVDQLSQEVSQLRSAKQNKAGKLKKIGERQKKFGCIEEYQRLKGECSQLEKESQKWPEMSRLNIRLKKDKDQLEKRIEFLRHVDVEMVNQKRSLLRELKQRHIILENQRNSYNQQLAAHQQTLNLIEFQNKGNIQLQKKPYKKKRQVRPKGEKKTKEEQVQTEQHTEFEEKRVNRWKGKQLRKKCFMGFLILIVVGLLVGSMSTLRF